MFLKNIVFLASCLSPYTVDKLGLTLCFVSVLVPPSFVETPVSGDSKLGEDVNWSCKAHGKPIPHITWYKDNQQLDGQTAIKITNSETSNILQANSMLKIERCDLRSEGATYRVEAENKAGKVSHTFSFRGGNCQMFHNYDVLQ